MFAQAIPEVSWVGMKMELCCSGYQDDFSGLVVVPEVDPASTERCFRYAED